jgi:hypothetical protein
MSTTSPCPRSQERVFERLFSGVTTTASVVVESTTKILPRRSER